MIYRLHNKENFVYAYVIFDTLDIELKFKYNGPYIFIRDMWIHKDYRNKSIMIKMFTHICFHPDTKDSEFVYWIHGKTGRTTKLFNKEHLLNRSLLWQMHGLVQHQG